MQNNYRFYSFVAGLYLSPIQCGIQTAHAVSEMAVDQPEHLKVIYDNWAKNDKTLIVCQAVNHQGVVDAYEKFSVFAKELNLPCTIFREDEQSMNGMATAVGIVVPVQYCDAKPVFNDDHICRYEFAFTDPKTGVADGHIFKYFPGECEFQFIQLLKSFRLA